MARKGVGSRSRKSSDVAGYQPLIDGVSEEQERKAKDRARASAWRRRAAVAQAASPAAAPASSPATQESSVEESAVAHLAPAAAPEAAPDIDPITLITAYITSDLILCIIHSTETDATDERMLNVGDDPYGPLTTTHLLTAEVWEKVRRYAEDKYEGWRKGWRVGGGIGGGISTVTDAEMDLVWERYIPVLRWAEQQGWETPT